MKSPGMVCLLLLYVVRDDDSLELLRTTPPDLKTSTIDGRPRSLSSQREQLPCERDVKLSNIVFVLRPSCCSLLWLLLWSIDTIVSTL